MNSTLTLNPTLTTNTAFTSTQSLNDLVKAASKVISPLGPISTFAARTPWVGMEQESFEEVARRLKTIVDVDIYPNEFVLRSAQNRGEIRQEFLEIQLQKWLDSQSLDIPHDVAERFCRSALLLDDPLPSKPLEISELKKIIKKVSHFNCRIIKKQTVKTFSQRMEQLGDGRIAKDLNRHMIKWCKLFLDDIQAVWSMPNRENGFYDAWRGIIKYDPSLKSTVRKKLNEGPQNADDALMNALQEMDIPFKEIQEYLEAHLYALPGWAGMMLWRSQQSAKEHSLLLEYLAVRVSMECALIKPYLPLPKQDIDAKAFLEPLVSAWAQWGDMPVSLISQLPPTELEAYLTLAYRFDKVARYRLWLEAWEKTYEDQLMKLITSKQSIVRKMDKTVMAQFVFCIDVRSEPFRRQLEQEGPFETIGAAGFFGLPIATTKLCSHHSHNSLPVMFNPQFKVKEISSDIELKQYQQRNQVVNSLSSTFKTMKHSLPSSMLLPEISGPWLGVQTLARSFIPKWAGSTFHKIQKKWLRKPFTKFTIEREHTIASELPIGFTDGEKVNYVRQALKMMGLTNHFAPIVVICGHGSYSTNNPYSSALDCGACGGASSGFNARVFASLCNLPKVRQTLEKEGISIPEDTVFVAAEHITTTDELKWLYVPELSNTAKDAFNQVESILLKVSEKANAERIPQLPNIHLNYKKPKAEAERFAEDWSEVRPEWGLAGNAAIIIGERRLTQDCNLNGRVFLHNYNWQNDKNGDLLEAIINGPGTVCEWINLQYYASTVAPHYYGSGSKTTQTVTAGIGVMQGNASDLLIGLPWQSVMQSDQNIYHSPIRLLVVIQAPREYVERTLSHNQAFNQKVQNGWVRLASIDPEGIWESWS
ncbi:uncharacterized protein YbcC (UPF0753/DUF2309 family) [Oikeobacillus pervagus]|uniref:Probable inorganic carbon transporter subunit DabA n=2 Tax=Oikeobacillus pervagus TaxID=1325931 RepID=A0AAJ1T5S6_9BACI|nr:putative inorganic carbon transporter subunit DabA [Oikeobacillus pervagus]MDQ0216384.1 uncharacterized protein YbcC (UPF0753/DUF2309 family) [Oikeobacillus pervagus]